MASSKVQQVHSGNASYESLVLSYGPVGYWPLNDGTGTTAKNLVSGNNGTLAADTGLPTHDTQKFLTRDSSGSARFSGANKERITVSFGCIENPRQHLNGF